MKNMLYQIAENKPKLLIKPYFKKNYIELYELIESYNLNIFGPNDFKFSQKAFNWVNNIKLIPLCPTCHKKLNFRNFKIGYSKACNSTCLAKSVKLREERQSKIKSTTLERYGVEHILQSNDIQEQIKSTTLKRYGVDNISKLKSTKDSKKEKSLEKYGVECVFQAKNVIDKSQKTMYARYGNKHALNINKFKEKFKATNILKYGVDNPLKLQKVKDIFASDEYKAKRKKLNLEKFKKDIYNKYPDLDIIEIGYDRIISIKCSKCNKEYKINSHLLYQRRFVYKIKNPCLKCNPISSSKISILEKELYDFLKSLNIKNIEQCNRTILNGKELDIYIPEKKLAIEFDGLYWHSELFKDNNTHLNKTELCQEKNTQLIHIFEDEWIFKNNIVKSRLKNLLALTSTKIYARKTEVREINSKEAKLFLNENHIQGHINSSIKLGLYYNNELISLMTFGGLRKSMGSKSEEGHYELLRFCNKLNTSVIGGASKLFKYFKYEYKPKEIISYADRRWSKGDLYRQLGFKELEPSKPNYWYIVNNKREYRFKYRKSELIKEGFDKNKTEHEIMLERGINRIYDSGNLKFKYNN